MFRLSKEVLVAEITTMIEWLGENKLQANPDKFQAMMLGSKGYENCKSKFMKQRNSSRHLFFK